MIEVQPVRPSTETPAHFKMIIKLDKADEFHKGGTIAVAATMEKFESMEQSSDEGVIVHMGGACFNHDRFTGGLDPVVGQRIRFKQYCGYGFHEIDGDGEKHNYVLINDDDFLTIKGAG